MSSKTMKFTASQEGILLSLEFAIGEPKKTSNIKSKTAGSICNELFQWVDMQRTAGVHGLKLSKPINLKFEVAGIKFDSSTIQKELQERLILRNNPTGRKNYARRFHSIFQYVTKDVQTITFEQLIADLEKDEAMEKMKVAA